MSLLFYSLSFLLGITFQTAVTRQIKACSEDQAANCPLPLQFTITLKFKLEKFVAVIAAPQQR